MIKQTTCQIPGCQNLIHENESNFCASCWYPGIIEDYQRYLDLRHDGYSSYQAKLMVGWADPS